MANKDPKLTAKYTEVIERVERGKQQRKQQQKRAMPRERDIIAVRIDENQAAYELERFAEEFDQYRSGKEASSPQSEEGDTSQCSVQARAEKGKPYRPGITRFSTHLENIFTPMGFEKHGDKVRNRYGFASVEDSARNTGTAVYVRYALTRMLDMVRIRQGDTFKPFMQWIVATDSVPAPRLVCGYAAKHPAQSLEIDELGILLGQDIGKDQLIAGLTTCFWLNFKFKRPATGFRHGKPDKELTAENKKNQKQRVKRAIERAVASCIGSGASDPDSEWVRLPGGTRIEPGSQAEAEIVQVKLRENLARV